MPTVSPHERWALHVETWRNCQECLLCTQRDKIVLARGVVPCDVLFLGEAPGMCITGDSLVEVAYRDKKLYPDGIPIMDLVGKSGFKVYSCVDGRLTLGNVKKVWSTGEKETYEVKYFWWGAPPNGKGGRQKYYGSLRVTSNHPFMLKDGTYKSIDSGLSIGNSLQPFYRFSGKYNMVGLHSTQRFHKKFPDVDPLENHEVISIDSMGVQEVYDMEVEDFHNFAVNGVFVHNSEDSAGLPFHGPAGQKLDEIVAAVRGSTKVNFTDAYTNLVCCYPADAKQTDNHQPHADEIMACSPRLQEFVDIAQPKLIVCVGKLANDWGAICVAAPNVQWCHIVHPSKILRMPLIQQYSAIRNCVVVLRDAIELALTTIPTLSVKDDDLPF